MRALEISLSGLDVEWRRLEVIAENLANAGTASTPGGAVSGPLRLLSGPTATFGAHLDDAVSRVTGGVTAYALEPTNLPPRIAHEPAHPLADENGDVSYPGLDHAAEMLLMVKTARAYEANLVMMSTAREMYMKAIELGRAG